MDKNYRPVNPAKDSLSAGIEAAFGVLAHLPQIILGFAVIAFLAGAGLVAAVLCVANWIGG